MLNCGKELAGSCDGGHPAGAFQWIQNNNIVFDTCKVYEAKDDIGCTAKDVCEDCMGFGNCWAVEKDVTTHTADDGFGFITTGYNEASISAHGYIKGEEAMLAELALYGPITCGVDAIPLLGYKAGIVTTSATAREIDHVVSIVGWGVEDGVKFWEVRNQWGDYWGEDGWFRVERGVNALAIESDCFWVQPKAWGHLGVNGTAAYDQSKNYDADAVERFSRAALKQAKLGRQAVDLAVLTGPAPLSIYAGYMAGLFLGAGLVAAAFSAGKRSERNRLYEMTEN